MTQSTGTPRVPKIRKSRPEEQRSQTMSRRQILRESRRRQRLGEVVPPVEYWRPRTRADCATIGRPCLYVACKHHLYLDINPETGSVKVNFPGREVWELEHTCALDLAEEGGITLEDVGVIMNLTRERIRQLESSAVKKIRAAAREYELDDFQDWDPHRDDAL